MPNALHYWIGKVETDAKNTTGHNFYPIMLIFTKFNLLMSLSFSPIVDFSLMANYSGSNIFLH